MHYKWFIVCLFQGYRTFAWWIESVFAEFPGLHMRHKTIEMVCAHILSRGVLGASVHTKRKNTWKWILFAFSSFGIIEEIIANKRKLQLQSFEPSLLQPLKHRRLFPVLSILYGMAFFFKNCSDLSSTKFVLMKLKIASLIFFWS